MTEFHRCQTVKARKQHICEDCGQPIEVGEEHAYSAQKFEGQFDTYREHPDCREACFDLNFTLRDLSPYEGVTFLRHDEIEDGERDWLAEKYPAVAKRLWGELT